jgi:hypothetical protein
MVSFGWNSFNIGNPVLFNSDMMIDSWSRRELKGEKERNKIILEDVVVMGNRMNGWWENGSRFMIF